MLNAPYGAKVDAFMAKQKKVISEAARNAGIIK